MIHSADDEEHWKIKCQRFVDALDKEAALDTPRSPRQDTPRSARSIIPPVRWSRRDLRPETARGDTAAAAARKTWWLSSVPLVRLVAGGGGRVVAGLLLVAAAAAWLYLTAATAAAYSRAARTTVLLQTRPQDTSAAPALPYVTLCNQHILRHTSLAGTRFSELAAIDARPDGAPLAAQTPARPAVEELLAARPSLRDALSPESRGGDAVTWVREAAGRWADVYARADGSWSGLHRSLQRAGLPDAWPRLLLPAAAELAHLGLGDGSVRGCRLGDAACPDSSVHLVTDPHYGQCVQIRPVTSGQHSAAGSRELRVLLDSATPGLSLLSATAGHHAIVHAPHMPFQHAAYTVAVPPGAEVTVTAQREEYKRHSGACGDSTVEACRERCLEAAVVAHCGCGHGRAPADGGCDMRDAVHGLCVFTVEAMEERGLLRNCSCPPPCREVTYKLTGLTSQPWPSQIAMKHVLSDLAATGVYVSETQLRSNFAVLRVKILDDVRHINEKPEMSPLELVAALGGVSAASVGVSAAAVLELLVLLCLACRLRNTRTARAGKNRVRYQPSQPAPAPVSAAAPQALLGPGGGLVLQPSFRAHAMYLPPVTPSCGPDKHHPLQLTASHLAPGYHRPDHAPAERYISLPNLASPPPQPPPPEPLAHSSPVPQTRAQQKQQDRGGGAGTGAVSQLQGLTVSPPPTHLSVMAKAEKPRRQPPPPPPPTGNRPPISQVVLPQKQEPPPHYSGSRAGTS